MIAQEIQARWMNWLFWAMVALGLLPLALFAYLPTSDGPAHVYNARLLIEYFVHHGTVEHQYFRANPVIVPNWLGHAALAAAMTVTSPAIAERALVALYVIALPLSFRYALRAAAGRSSGYECLVFPFVYNMHLFWGFYNFCLSLPLYLIGVGFWLSRASQLTKAALFGFSALAVIVYLASPVALLELMLSVGFLGVCGLIDLHQRRARLTGLAWTCGAFVPSIVLFSWYAFGRVHAGRDAVGWPSLRYAGSTLLTLAPISAYLGPERIVSGAVAALIGLLIFRAAVDPGQGLRMREWKFPLLAAGLAALVFVAPTSAAGGTLLTPRLVYFPIFVIALWIGSRLDSNVWRGATACAAAGLALTLLLLRLPIAATYNQSMADLRSVEPSLQPGKTLLFVTFSDPFPQNLDPSTRRPPLSGHAGGYLAADRQLVLLSNYEAHMDHFPFLFEEGRDPYGVLIRERQTVSCGDLARYHAQSGGRADYIVEWNGDGSNRLSSCGYVPVTLGADSRSVSLYELVERPLAARGSS